MKNITLLACTLLLGISSYGQIQNDIDAVVKHKVLDESIVDSVFGITLYEPLNMVLSGDSVRENGGYACKGWITDNYDDGKLLHKGFYIDGQLKAYKNYYPNGNMERDFRSIDNFNSMLKLYYPNGELKSSVRYVNGLPQLWIDYYDDGTMKYYEEHHRSMEYQIAKKFYYDNGNPQDILELDNKKKMLYNKDEFFRNGNEQVDGTMHYDRDVATFYRTGTWKYYNESGDLKKEIKYSDGKVLEEKKYD